MIEWVAPENSTKLRRQRNIIPINISGSDQFKDCLHKNIAALFTEHLVQIHPVAMATF